MSDKEKLEKIKEYIDSAIHCIHDDHILNDILKIIGE